MIDKPILSIVHLNLIEPEPLILHGLLFPSSPSPSSDSFRFWNQDFVEHIWNVHLESRIQSLFESCSEITRASVDSYHLMLWPPHHLHEWFLRLSFLLRAIPFEVAFPMTIEAPVFNLTLRPGSVSWPLLHSLLCSSLNMKHFSSRFCVVLMFSLKFLCLNDR